MDRSWHQKEHTLGCRHYAKVWEEPRCLRCYWLIDLIFFPFLFSGCFHVLFPSLFPFFLGNVVAYVMVSDRDLVVRIPQTDHSSGASLGCPVLPGPRWCIQPFEGLVNQQEVCSPVTRGGSWRVFMREYLTWVMTLSFPMRVGMARLAQETWQELGFWLSEAGASCLF